MSEPIKNIAVIPAEVGKMIPVRLERGERKFLKVDFPTPRKGVVERMWVLVDEFESRVGILHNEPQMVPGVKNGDTVFFTKNEEDYEHYVMTSTDGGMKDAI